MGIKKTQLPHTSALIYPPPTLLIPAIPLYLTSSPTPRFSNISTTSADTHDQINPKLIPKIPIEVIYDVRGYAYF